MYLIGDVGGTKTRLGIVKDKLARTNRIFDKIYIFNTPQKYEEFLELIKNYILHHSASVPYLPTGRCVSSALKICFGFAGNFDAKKEKLIYAPNLKDYVGRNLKRDLIKILLTRTNTNFTQTNANNIGMQTNAILTQTNTNNLDNIHVNPRNYNPRNSAYNNPHISVVLENDAALAGLGEGYLGAGKNLKIFGYITLSTGIGGVKIIRRELMRDKFLIDDNIFGFEPGHSFLLLQSKTYDVLPFEIEELIGGKSLEKILGKKLEKIKDKKIWDDLSKILAIFLVNVSIFWSVDKIILGGGLTKSLNFKKLNFYVNKFHPLPIKIKIIKSKLKDLAGLYGGWTYLNYGMEAIG